MMAMPAHNKVSIFLVGIVCGVFVGLKPDVVLAHGFGDRYDLPVPLSFYMIGAGMTVVLSFFAFGYFYRRRPPQTTNKRYRIEIQFTGEGLLYRLSIASIKFLSVFFFILCIVTGLFGSQTATDNLTPTMVWIIFWAFMCFTSALIGNLWPLINPWLILFTWSSTIYKWITNRSPIRPYRTYPIRLMFWPAVFFLIVFSWIEIIYPYSSVPKNLSVLILTYSIITWTGMWYFGKDTWSNYGEVFGVTFSTISKLSPIQVHKKDRKGRKTGTNKLVLQPHGSSLLLQETLDISKTLFVLVLLATVTFDGLTTTPFWEGTIESLKPFFKDILLIHSFGYLILIIIFTFLYFTFCRLMIFTSGVKVDIKTISAGLVYSLIPISIAYHLAHYTSFILIQGQLIIPLLSDPFGFKWDILGTRNYEVDIGIVNALFIWYLSVIVIVVGHIMAIFISHFRSISLFGTFQAALRSQFPMLILMVGYTMISLWITSQPIIE